MQRGNIWQQSVIFLFRLSPKSTKWQAIEDILLILITEKKLAPLLFFKRSAHFGSENRSYFLKVYFPLTQQ
jgi:hypothetical protein